MHLLKTKRDSAEEVKIQNLSFSKSFTCTGDLKPDLNEKPLSCSKLCN